MSKKKHMKNRTVSNAGSRLTEEESKQLTKKMDYLLRKIDKEYQNEDFSYYSLIGKSLENKSIHHDLKSLSVYEKKLSVCLNSIVDQNYQGFFQTVTNFSDILKNLDSSQSNISRLIKGIEECENLLTLDHDSITNLFTKYKQNKEYIGILESIERMMKIPNKIYHGIKTKHYLYTVNLINENIEEMKHEKYKNIKGIQIIKSTLHELIDTIPEKLFDELSNFTYNAPNILHSHDKKMDPLKVSSPKNRVIPNLIRRSKRHRRRSSGSGGINMKNSKHRLEELQRSSNSRKYSIVKDDMNSPIVPNTSKYIQMLIKSVLELNIITEAKNRLKQTLHLKFSALIDNHIKKFLHEFKNSEICYEILKNKRKRFSNVTSKDGTLRNLQDGHYGMGNSQSEILELIYLQKDSLLQLFTEVFQSLIRVLKNFKYLIKKMNELETFKEAKKKMQSDLEKKYTGYKGKESAKPSNDATLKQKLTKDNLLKIREGIRLAIDEKRIKVKENENNSRNKETYNGDIEYLNSMEEILNNFIEMELQQSGLRKKIDAQFAFNQRINQNNTFQHRRRKRGDDLSKMEAIVILDIFKDKIKSEITTKRTNTSVKIQNKMMKKCNEKFRKLLINSLGHSYDNKSRQRNMNKLTLQNIWNTMQMVVKEKLLNEILNIESSLKNSHKNIINERTELQFSYTENNIKQANLKSNSQSTNNNKPSFGIYSWDGNNSNKREQGNVKKSSFASFFITSLYNLIWISKPLLNFAADAHRIIYDKNELQREIEKEQQRILEESINNNKKNKKIPSSFNGLPLPPKIHLNTHKELSLEEFVGKNVKETLLKIVEFDYKNRIETDLNEKDIRTDSTIIILKPVEQYTEFSTSTKEMGLSINDNKNKKINKNKMKMKIRSEKIVTNEHMDVHEGDGLIMGKIKYLDRETNNLKQYIEELLLFAKEIPEYHEVFFSVIQELLQVYLIKSEEMLGTLIEGTFLEQTLLSKNKETKKLFLNVLSKDPLWIKLNQNDTFEMYGSGYSPVITERKVNSFNVELKEKIDKLLLEKKHVRKSDFIDNSSDFIRISHVHNSMEFIRTFITKAVEFYATDDNDMKKQKEIETQMYNFKAQGNPNNDDNDVHIENAKGSLKSLKKLALKRIKIKRGGVRNIFTDNTSRIKKLRELKNNPNIIVGHIPMSLTSNLTENDVDKDISTPVLSGPTLPTPSLTTSPTKSLTKMPSSILKKSFEVELKRERMNNLARIRLITFAKNFRNPSKLCLFAIKIDIRTHCYYYLSTMYESKYYLEKPSSEPESFIQNLNNDMNRIERILLKYISKRKVKYVFHGVGKLICDFFLNSIVGLKIKKVNENGVKQMKRNIISLKQNLSNILGKENFFGRENHFLYVKNFCDLMKMNGNELFNHVKKICDDIDRLEKVDNNKTYKNDSKLKAIARRKKWKNRKKMMFKFTYKQYKSLYLLDGLKNDKYKNEVEIILKRNCIESQFDM